MFCSGCGANNLEDAGFCKACGKSLNGAVSGELVYAGFWIRFAALFLDGFVLFAMQVPALFIVAMISGGSHSDTPFAFGGMYNIVLLGISAGYFTLMESGEKSATFGKRMLGLKVVDLDGERLTAGRALGRWVSHFFSNVTLFIGYLIQPFTQKKQALHDLIAGTAVVENSDAKGSNTALIIGIVIAVPVMIAIVGILAAIAIPQYQTYVVKSKMVEAMSVGNQATKQVESYYLQTKRIPATLEEAGYHQRPEQINETATIDPDHAVVSVQFNVSSGTMLNHKTLVFTPGMQPDQTLSWVCTSEIPAIYLPADCQHQ